MSAFGTQDMAAALPTTNATGPNPQEHGWTKPTPIDYATYNKSSKELMDERIANESAAAASAGIDSQAGNGQAPVDNSTFGQDGVSTGEWAGNAPVYEYQDEYGDVGPRFAALENELFGGDFRLRTGINFDNIAKISVTQEGAVKVKPVFTFSEAGLHPAMLENVKLAGYTVPTPIQQYTIPAVLGGHDLVACAQTGSGKTAAFMIPILSKLMGKAKKLAAPRPNPATFISGVTPGVRAEPLVLIVAPSRELATQIFDEARRFCYRTMLRPCVIYGGGPFREQITQLEKGCDVLVGTPGRLCDFINRPALLTLRRLKYIVIDEADEMLASDWEQELKQIMSGGDQEEGNIKYLMFSATFPKIARELATQHLAHNHVRIHVGRAGSSHTNITQTIVFVEPSQKRKALMDLLMSIPPARTIIFVNSKRTADEVDDFLFNAGMPCTSIHSDRTQREREDCIRAFRIGKCPILIATGVSARGLDIIGIMHVINYDMPSNQYGGIQEYTHRIGRTGRMGNNGLATSFFNDRDTDLAPTLVKTLLETHQIIPDFLEEHIPEGFTADGKGDVTTLKFEDDEEEENADEGGGDAWGAEPSAEAEVPSVWGSNETAPPAPAPTAAQFSAPPANAWGSAPVTAAPIAPTPVAAAPPSTNWGQAPPQGKFASQPPAQSNWGAQAGPPAPQNDGAFGAQSQQAAPGFGAPPSGQYANGFGGPPPAETQQYGQSAGGFGGPLRLTPIPHYTQAPQPTQAPPQQWAPPAQVAPPAQQWAPAPVQAQAQAPQPPKQAAADPWGASSGPQNGGWGAPSSGGGNGGW